MISENARLTVKYGRLSLVKDSIMQGGVQRKAAPAPRQELPSTSSIIPHTSVMSANEIDKSSWAFVARIYKANLPATNNHNANGSLNA